MQTLSAAEKNISVSDVVTREIKHLNNFKIFQNYFQIISFDV